MTAAICPYCNKPARIVGGDAIYPDRRDLALLKFHLCSPCDAYVGCHAPGARFRDAAGRKVVSDGTLPMGRLANSELRRARMAAHQAFDPTWRNAGTPRRAAYEWLANQLKLPVDRTHIGGFDVAQCRQVVEICQKKVAA